jgi:phosphomannomutase
LTEARAWIEGDPEPATRAELEALIARGDGAGLRARFEAPLGFGTAGLRGPVGAGPARMNRAVVARTTAGLCAVLAREVPDAARLGLCVGFDGRRDSKAFAAEVAAVATGAGFVVYAFEEPVPTPLVAFSVLDRGVVSPSPRPSPEGRGSRGAARSVRPSPQPSPEGSGSGGAAGSVASPSPRPSSEGRGGRGAAAGVMITASHNPASDNGIKIYWSDGAQVLAPDDAAITAVANATSARALPRWTPDEARARGLLRATGRMPRENYLRAITSGAPEPGPRTFRIAYTAVHGVGEPLMRDALGRVGFSDVHSVAEQANPDPDFPTAPRPNPEEPGVMSRVLALADAVAADLVLANDPDADRLAAVARDRSGAMRSFTGNEVGALLADHLLDLDPDPARALIIGTIVSTPLASAVARARGATYAATLTGFKWIMRRARELEREEGVHLVLGFEEALGYAVCPAVRDKDGISAGVALALLAEHEKSRGRTLVDRLHDLWRAHGVHVSGQATFAIEVARAQALMTALRTAPPDALLGTPIVAIEDLASGTRRTGARIEPAALPRSDVLVWELHGGDRIALRPSGTEPKLKVYLDVREPIGSAETVATAERRARERLATVTAAVSARLRP